MKKTTFGRTGFEVSVLGFGAGPIGYLKTDRERASQVLNLLLDSGINVIDTAASYEAAEEVIGDSIGRRRSEFVLISKCGSRVPDVAGEPWSAALVSATVDRALRRLKTDHLDVMLLHSCDLATLKKGEALGALTRAREAGKIRWAGYSGDNEAAAWAAAQNDVAVVETSINIVDQANIDRVLPIARQHNVGVIAKRPIANAAWKAERPGVYQNYGQTYADRLKAMELIPADAGLLEHDETAWAEMALRFTLSVPGVHTAIIGTTSPENVRTNIAAADKGPLPPDAAHNIRKAFKEAPGSDTWKALT